MKSPYLSEDDLGIFWSAGLKLKRAYKHIHEVEAWIRAFLDTDIEIARANPFRGAGASFPVMVSWPPMHVSENLGPIVGDAVHNLRAALDHVASEIVERGGGDATRMYFPMNDTLAALRATREYRLIQTLSRPLATAISDEIKPFRDGGQADFHALNHLDRADKHRLIIMPSDKSSATLTVILDENEVPEPVFGTRLFVLSREGKQLPITPGSPADLYNQENGYHVIDICFGEGSILKDQPVVPILHRLAQLVDLTISALQGVMLKEIEASFIRSESAASGA